jgi:hypothetical protein
MTFVQEITYNSGLASVNTDPMFGGLQGLAFVGLNEGFQPVLYATTGAPASTGNALVKFVDTGSAASFTHVATAPANSAFRGVALAPDVAFQTADFNQSGTVDGDDLTIWKTSFGPAADADADSDGDSEGSDFLVWQRQVGAVSVASVPEPGVSAITVAAMVFLRGRGRGLRLPRKRWHMGSASAGVSSHADRDRQEDQGQDAARWFGDNYKSPRNQADHCDGC